VAGYLERLGQRRDDPGGDLGRLVDRSDTLEHHGELVAAEAGGEVGGAQVQPQPVGDPDQQQVARRVAERVVDRLEPVEVDEEQRQGVLPLR
jgi:hypothetical protein